MNASQKGNIFISYRRADTMFAAGRIYDRLVEHFGEDAIFMDVEAIDGGVDAVDVIEAAVQACDVVLVIIGKQWLYINDERGERRLDNPEDFVRIEVSAALERKIRVIPVLVEFAEMPRSTELPENLKRLARRNALPVDHRSFHADVSRLIEHTERALKAAETAQRATENAARLAKEKRDADLQALIEKRAEERARQLALEMAQKAREEKAKKEEIDLTGFQNLSGLSPQNPAGIEWIKIPAGEFIMGSNDIGRSKPERKVHLPDYLIAKTPVTNAQFKKFMNAGGYTNEAFWSAQGWQWRESQKRSQPDYWTNRKWNTPTQPVVGVSWYEAEAFANWANCRLPSEAEWEKAARGTDGRKYPWGDQTLNKKLANYDDYPNGKTTPVGKYSPAGDSPYGCVDMAGNVLEWSADWYDVYPGGDPNASSAFGEKYKVLRGGSWNYNYGYLRVAYRSNDTPGVTSSYVGFRCSRSLP